MLTMRYRILDTHDRFEEARKDIELALRLMNERFTWPHGPLTLTPSAASTTRDPGTGFPIVARGEMTIDEDRWSAMLVVCFLRWVSERLPQSFVELIDESRLCHLGLVVFREGHFGIPIPGNARSRRFATDRAGGPDALLRALGKAADGDFLLAVPAEVASSRPEVRSLGLRESELRRMSLQELTDRMPFPWKTERLGTA